MQKGRKSNAWLKNDIAEKSEICMKYACGQTCYHIKIHINAECLWRISYTVCIIFEQNTLRVFLYPRLVVKSIILIYLLFLSLYPDKNVALQNVEFSWYSEKKFPWDANKDFFDNLFGII